jgi:HEAT repeat protein
MRTKILVTLIALVGLAIAFLALQKRGGEPPERDVPVTALADATSPLTLSWPAGRAVSSRFVWRHEQSSTVANAALRADVALSGKLELTGLGRDPSDGTWRARVRLLALEEARYRVLNSDLAAESAAWIGRDAFVRFAYNGAVLDVRERAGAKAGDPFPLVMRALLQAAQVTSQVTGVEDTALGSSRVRYAGDGLSRTRTRVGYDRIEGLEVARHEIDVRGDARIRINAAGYVEEMTASDTVVARNNDAVALTARSSLQWSAVSSRQVNDLATPALAAAPDPRGAASPALERKLRESQAAGLTRGQLVAELQRIAAGGDAPAQGWLPRAAGLLRLEPEAATDIASVVTHDRATTTARAVGLDLLSQVGHEKAQAALIDALEDESVQTDPSYALLLQRLSFVSTPTSETLAFATQMRRSEDADLRRSATYAYGALAAGLARSARADEANAIVDALAGELRGGGEVGDQAARLAALGNAGTPEAYEAVVAFADDEEASLRGAAAAALRGAESRAEREVLVGLVGDPAATVQRAAIRSLTERRLAAWEQSRVAGLVQQGRTARPNDGVVVTLLQERVAGTARDDALRFLLDRATDRPRLRARIRSILGGP